jgi:predicted metal-binding membrane protein/pimeloyl-ACP methyl ester carboxylesterase
MDRLAGRSHTLAADLYGSGQSPAWPCERPLWLADEVALLAPVFAAAGPRFHLVGHSYGGAVALMAALADPGRVESLVVFEPVLFSLLTAEDPARVAALEIAAVRDDTVAAVQAGALSASGARFVDYWMGPGTWAGMPEARREAIATQMQQVKAEWHAVFMEPTPLSVFAALDVPVLCLTGSESPATGDRRRCCGGGAHGAPHASGARQRPDRGLPRAGIARLYKRQFRWRRHMTLVRKTSIASVILLFAAVAWAATLGMTHAMTSELPFLGFMGVWIMMMAAMMLPALAPLASRYARMIEASRSLGAFEVVSGYLGVWALAGILAYLLAGLVAIVGRSRPGFLTPMAVLIYVVGGVYQFTTLKDRCLTTCRAPLAQLLEYAAWQGRFRHVRVGFHHGLYCSGCCWSMMLLLFAFGLMNTAVMVVLAAVVTVEKLWTRGRWFSYAVGAACWVLAIGVLRFPRLAPGLSTPTAMMLMP